MTFAEYVLHGWRITPIAAGKKSPAQSDWNRPKNCIRDPLVAQRLSGAGLCHAYSGTCALDIDDVERGHQWLAERGVDLQAIIERSDNVFIHSGRPNRVKLLFALPEALPSTKVVQDKMNIVDFRCGTRDNLTVQDVLPPTIHPDTGRPYEWRYDELITDWRTPPQIPQELLAVWQQLLAEKSAIERNDDAEIVEDWNEIRQLLAGMDPDADYERWIHAGMAIHSATDGAGFELWDEWSAQGEKYKGPADLRTHWRSFKGGGVTIGYLRMQQTAPEDAFDELPEDEAPARSRFQPVHVSEWVQRPPPAWLIDDLLPQSELAMLFGAPGAGKSFMALDLAMHIATGTPWRDRDVVEGPVMWIAAEAAGSVRNRALAYARHNDLELADAALWIVGDRPNLGAVEDVRALLDAGQQIKPKLIVVDTLSAASGGANENSGEDMGTVLAGCAALHKVTGALVLLIHHSGKDAAKGARGWSGIKGAMQTELEVRETTGELRAMTVVKQRDGEQDIEFDFKLVPVLLDPFGGKPQGSCAVEAVDDVMRAREQVPPPHYIAYVMLALGKGDPYQSPMPEQVRAPQIDPERTMATLAGLAGAGLLLMDDEGVGMNVDQFDIAEEFESLA